MPQILKSNLNGFTRSILGRAFHGKDNNHNNDYDNNHNNNNDINKNKNVTVQHLLDLPSVLCADCWGGSLLNHLP